MEYYTLLAMIMTEYCTTTTILIMTITTVWLVKQVELLHNIVNDKPKVKDNFTQTVQQEENLDCSSTQRISSKIRKRRSHRNGKQNYLRKWPGSYL